MKADEKRIQSIEVQADQDEAPEAMPYLQVAALCEIARQLSRIADAYEGAHS